jgi:hypothetical protein
MKLISAWKREGLIGTLLVHIALFFLFVLIVGHLNLAIEHGLASWLEGTGPVQAITALLLFLALFVAAETVLFALLLRPYLRGALAEPRAQRAWIAFVMIGGMLIAMLTSPIVFGSFSLILPGIPEIIVLISFPFVTKAIKARD